MLWFVGWGNTRVSAKKLRETFRGEWARVIKFVQASGVSAGAARALEAHVELDVEDTMQALAETGRADPVRGAAVTAMWLEWYPRYVEAETRRVLPELSQRWPGERARRERQTLRRKMERWCSDGEDVLRVIERAHITPDVARRKLGMPIDRFDKIVAALKAIGAAKVVDDGALIQTAQGVTVQAQLRERWLGEGSDAPEFVDPLPEGCSWTQPSTHDDADNR